MYRANAVLSMYKCQRYIRSREWIEVHIPIPFTLSMAFAYNLDNK